MIRTIGILVYLYITSSNIFGQSLPIFKGNTTNLSNGNEIAVLSYVNQKYTIDNDLPFYSARQIGRVLCEKLKKEEPNEYGLIASYVTLKIDKDASVLVLDSIFNELVSLNLTWIQYKTDYSQTSGLVYRLLTEKTSRREEMLNRGNYVPQHIDIMLCNTLQDNQPKEVSPNNQNDIALAPPPPPPPAPTQQKVYYSYEFIPKLNKDSTVDGKKVYIIAKSKDGFKINGAILNKISADTKIKKIIEKQNCIIVIEMQELDTYNDFLSILDLTLRNFSVVKSEFPNKNYSLNLTIYSITDKRFLKSSK